VGLDHIPNLVSGNYDAVVAAMNVTPERDAAIDFSEPYVSPPPSSLVAFSSNADLAEGVVAAQTSTLEAGHVSSTGATLLEFATGEEAVAAVRNGEAYAEFLEPVVDAPRGALTFASEELLLGQGIALGLRESDTELKAAFDTAIQSMKADGSLNALIEQWLGTVAEQF
jgi:polar amino acid transport system substrate-binding protein